MLVLREYEASTSFTQIVNWPAVEVLLLEMFQAMLEMVQALLKNDASLGV